VTDARAPLPASTANATVEVSRLVGLWRGAEVDGPARMSREDGALSFERARGATLRIPFASLEGLEVVPPRALLYVRGGDLLDVRLDDDDARAFFRAVQDDVFALPEFTRSLRHLGASPARGGGEACERWFAPLLAARRRAAGVTDPLRQAALLEADQLAREMAVTLAELAALRTGGAPAPTRALEAMLEEETESVREALAGAALAAATLQGGAADTRLADWREWVQQVQVVFRRADEAWPGMERVMGGWSTAAGGA
jgi:hypothetical protein